MAAHSARHALRAPAAPQILKCPYKSRPEENKEKEHLHYTNTVDSWAVRARACATGAED